MFHEIKTPGPDFWFMSHDVKPKISRQGKIKRTESRVEATIRPLKVD